MADILPQFETEDNAGRTENFSGTATTTVSQIPAVAGESISGYLFIADERNIELSDDGGITFFPVKNGEAIIWDVKGNITQLHVRSTGGNRDYRCKINFEEN